MMRKKCEDYDDDDDGDTVCGSYTHGFSILSREWILVIRSLL